MKVLFISIIMVVASKAHYHDRIGIPLAAKIKAYEDKLFANPEMESRVVGGEPVYGNFYPYMASLTIQLDAKNVSVCGSSLVTTTRLVTAGHCVDSAMKVKARLGTNYLFHGGFQYLAKDFKTHPSYKNTPLTHDIAIVTLPLALNLSEKIAVISLPRTPEENEVIGEYGRTAGWGLTSDAQRNATDPQSKPFDRNWELSEVALKIIPEETCEWRYDSAYLHGTTICCDGNTDRGLCDGDSGGPLVVMREDTEILIGVASAAYYLCEFSFPSVFVRTKYYTDFILS